MIERGWSKQTFKPGDAESPSRSSRSRTAIRPGEFWSVVLPNGQELSMAYLQTLAES